MVLTHDLWRHQFGGDPAILNKTILLDGFPHVVIGVMPKSFHMPSVLATIGDASHPLGVEALVPLAFSKERLAEDMGDLNYFGLARLRAGVSIAAANADLNTLQHTIAANLPPDEKATLSAKLTPFQEKLVGSNRKPLMILLAAVVGLLLVGCVNVTNLLLSRAVGQKRQMAVAAALGAGRAEMVRMAIRETIVLAVMGGGLGVLLAAAIVPAMQRYLPPALDFRGPLHLDWAGVGCALLLAVPGNFSRRSSARVHGLAHGSAGSSAQRLAIDHRITGKPAGAAHPGRGGSSGEPGPGADDGLAYYQPV